MTPDQHAAFEELARDLAGWVGASYSRFDASPTDFNLAAVNVALSYVVWRSISVGVNYTYQRSDSDQSVPTGLTAGVVDGNLVSLFLNASYPVQRDL